MIRHPADERDPLREEQVRLDNKKQLVIQTTGLLPGGAPESIESGQTILELGCGPGAWTLEIARLHPDVSVTGIDTNSSMISFAQEMARQRGQANLLYQVKE